MLPKLSGAQARALVRVRLVVQRARQFIWRKTNGLSIRSAPKFRKHEIITASGLALVRISSVMPLPAYDGLITASAIVAKQLQAGEE